MLGVSGDIHVGAARLAGIGPDGQIHFWSLETGVRMAALPVQSGLVRFSTDGHRLFSVSMDGKLTVLNAAPWEAP